MSSVVNLALPNHEDAPSKCAESFAICLVALFIARKLWHPIAGARFRNMCFRTPPVLMPKAASNFNYLFAGPKN